MTGKVKGEVGQRSLSPLIMSGLHVECERSARGMTLTASGIIGVSEISDETICLKSQGGRIYVLGHRLTVTVLEGGCVEISGKIEGMRFGYGKA